MSIITVRTQADPATRTTRPRNHPAVLVAYAVAGFLVGVAPWALAFGGAR